jgi:hypothetical protein
LFRTGKPLDVGNRLVGWRKRFLWAEVAKQTLAENHRQPPSIVCVDPWTSYLSLEGNPHLGSMRRAALSDKIFSLFLHNIKSSGHGDVIISLRTWSDVAARFFRTDLFDMVYIDGDSCLFICGA